MIIAVVEHAMVVVLIGRWHFGNKVSVRVLLNKGDRMQLTYGYNSKAAIRSRA